MASPVLNQQGSIAGSTPRSDVSSCGPAGTGSRPKRPSESLLEAPSSIPNRRKAAKVSRACDHCKVKKLKCTGTLPCNICTLKGLSCQYNAEYRRGKAPKPTASKVQSANVDTPAQANELTSDQHPDVSVEELHELHRRRFITPGPSPSLSTAEIEGQIIDPTSNLTFVHRAWRRLAQQSQSRGPNVLIGSESSQPLMCAGDVPFPTTGTGQEPLFVNVEAATDLFNFYFDNCIVTYRLLHRQQCLSWFYRVLENSRNGLPLHYELNHAKAATVVNILAIASYRQYTTPVQRSSESQTSALSRGEQYFVASRQLTEAETGFPRLESVQARVLQALYLLQTSRMNQAWYLFGCIVPIVSALGLHRKAKRYRAGGNGDPTADYIVSECRKRTFWVVYTIDKYLAVVFGRPRFYHDDDADQDFPERVNDEDMTTQGPSTTEPQMDCHVDSMISHARIAQIIDNTSREVYSSKATSNNDRLAAAQKFTQKLHNWREALPPYLGTVRPSSLIPSFGRQATALKLAYCHAMMHANRPFLLDQSTNSKVQGLDRCVAECLDAARVALETIDGMLSNATVPFCVLWWAPYVTFCALSIVYVWEIQHKAAASAESEDSSLFELAERCQAHLANATPGESASRRYSIIIEELRMEARNGAALNRPRPQLSVSAQQESAFPEHGDGRMLELLTEDFGPMFENHNDAGYSTLNSLSQWQPTDWLDLDSSAFGLFSELDLEGSLIL